MVNLCWQGREALTDKRCIIQMSTTPEPESGVCGQPADSKKVTRKNL